MNWAMSHLTGTCQNANLQGPSRCNFYNNFLSHHNKAILNCCGVLPFFFFFWLVGGSIRIILTYFAGKWRKSSHILCQIMFTSVFTSCCRLNCVPPNSYVEALTPNVTIFEGRAFKEVIKGKWGHKGGGLIQQDRCPYKKMKRHQEHAHTHDRACEDTVRRWWSTGQEDRPHQKPTLLAPWSWTSSLQSWDKINFCYLSHSVCGILVSTWAH